MRDDLDIREVRQRLDHLDNKRGRPRRRKLGCWSMFLIWVVLTALAVCAVVLTVRMVIGPAVKMVDALPGDFPQELTLYQLDQAKIAVADQQSKERLSLLVDYLPSWVVDLLADRLSENVSAKITSLNPQIGAAVSGSQIKQLLNSDQLKNITTVSLSWPDLKQSKEAVVAYYKQQLGAANFTFQEKLSDYQIDLGFWKDGVFGTLSVQNADKPDASKANMMVNYLNENIKKY